MRHGNTRRAVVAIALTLAARFAWAGAPPAEPLGVAMTANSPSSITLS
jgi:hypothetical protein